MITSRRTNGLVAAGAIGLAVAAVTLPALAPAIAVLACLAAAWLIWWRRRDLARIHELRGVAQAFSSGGFAQRAAISGDDPLARLGQDLNHLGGHLAGVQAALEAQRRLLDRALGSLSEGVACIDAVDQVIYANPTWRQLACGGVPAGGRFYEQIPAAVLSACVASVRAADPGSTDSVEFAHLRRDLRATVTRADQDLLVVALHDLTELKRLEEARRDFVAAVSHELKTPLTAIAGFTETLLDGALEDDPAAARDFIGKIARHAERLTILIRDVLTLSRLEQGGWRMRPEPLDLIALVRTLAEEFSAAAQARGVHILVEAPDRLEAVSDRELLHQLLGNLVSNAVRYNRPDGTVWIGLADDGPDRLVLTVRDTGIGIPAEHRERVFERFHRVDAHRSRQSGGTGLGLAIVKQLATTLGGGIALTSGPEGSLFTVVLPRVLGEKPGEAQQPG